MIYVILGTKGQFIKMFPLMKLFDKYKIPYKFIHTSQHYKVIEDNLKRFGIRKPDVYLTAKKADLRNFWDLLRWVPEALWNARKLKIKRNDWVLIHAGTESSLIALAVAKFFRASTAHVEAGYRVGGYFEPFPENLIVSVIDRFSDINFCAHKEDAENLKHKNVILTEGNTVFDSVRTAIKISPSINVEKLAKGTYVLFLIHRKENSLVKNRLNSIIDILEMILKKGHMVYWPLHANTLHELKRKGVYSRVLKLKLKYKLKISYFFNYIDFMHMVKKSSFVASDGGGLKDETYFLNVPFLILTKKFEEREDVKGTYYNSMLDKKRVEYFLDNYSKFERKRKIKESPSKAILSFFIKNK